MNTLLQYQTLIQALPVSEQAFRIKADNWKDKLTANHFEQIFKGQQEILLSRNDVHLTNNIDLFVIKTILWGYPKGMRGNNFGQIYTHLAEIASLLNIANRQHLMLDDLLKLQEELRAFRGLGLSTYSKLLYLRNFSFEGLASLILDDRLIKLFKNKVFQEFENLSNINEYNKDKLYPIYLKKMSELAKTLDTLPENIEQFLFLFGNNLKRNAI